MFASSDKIGARERRWLRGMTSRTVAALMAVALGVSAGCGSRAQAQTLNLLGLTTIALPPAGTGTFTIAVPVNILGTTHTINLVAVATPKSIVLEQARVTVIVAGRPVTINVPPRTIPIRLDLPTIDLRIDLELPAGIVRDALATIGATVAQRRNDALIGLDIGLDRQIDILGGGSSAGPDDSVGAAPAPRARMGAAAADWFGAAAHSGPSVGARDAEQASFSTSLQKLRQANAGYGEPYGLGAGGSRRPLPVAPSAFDIWAEGAFAWFADSRGSSESDGRWGVLYLGADYRVSRNVLVGALVQFDQSSQEFAAYPGQTRSNGWLAGPYAAFRLTENVFLQTRAAWGRSRNEIDLDGNAEDAFDAERWLVRATLLGQWRSGPWQFRPRASLGYVEEHQDEYLSKMGVTVPGQVIAIGQAKAGPEIAYRHRLADGSVVEPSLLVEGVWNFLQEGGGSNVADQASGDRLRARAEAGLSLRAKDGLTVGAAVSFDGIGSSDYQAVAGKARVRIPIN